MKSLRRVSRLAVLSVLLCAADASAQPLPHGDAERRARASEFYLRGREHFERGEYEAALADISRSYETFPLPAVLYNIATTQRRLGDLDSSILTFERYLREGADSVSVERRAEVEVALRELREGTVEVRFALAAPAGTSARVSVDGRALGDAPDTRAFRFAPGAHDFEATAPGMVPARERRVLSAGPLVTVTLRLAAPELTTGVLRLTINAPSPRVFVDAIARPQWSAGLSLERGPHGVRVEAYEYRPFADTVLLRAGETITVPVSLARIERGFFERPGGWVVLVASAVAVTVGVGVGVAWATRPVVAQQTSPGSTFCLQSRGWECRTF